MSGNDGAFYSCLFVVIMAGCSFSLAGGVVGEMEITIQCVFENALSQFHGKTVIPLSVFWCIWRSKGISRQSRPMFRKRSSINTRRTHNLTACQHIEMEEPTV